MPTTIQKKQPEPFSFQRHYHSVTGPANLRDKLPPVSISLNPASKKIKPAVPAQPVLENFNRAYNMRLDVYASLRSLSSRVVSAYVNIDAGKTMNKRIKFSNRKIQSLYDDIDFIPLPANYPLPVSIKASQHLFEQVSRWFYRIVIIICKDPRYKPAAPELTALGLLTTLANLKSMNLFVLDTYLEIMAERKESLKIISLRLNSLANPTAC